MPNKFVFVRVRYNAEIEEVEKKMYARMQFKERELASILTGRNKLPVCGFELLNLSRTYMFSMNIYFIYIPCICTMYVIRW